MSSSPPGSSAASPSADRPRDRPTEITGAFIESVCRRIADNKRVRRTLPIWGRLHIDRQLPFLCVYRRPPNGRAAGADTLVTSEASYLTASGARRLQAPLGRLVRRIGETLVAQFGSFLLLEIWEGPAGSDEDEADQLDVSMPRFRIMAPERETDTPYVHALKDALAAMRIAKLPAHAEIIRSTACAPKPFRPLIPERAARDLGCSILGLEVRPIYRDAGTLEPYPLVLRGTERAFTRALRRGLHEFSCTRTSHCPVHYDMLGRQAVVKAVWDVDQRLAEVSGSFDFLLQVTPVNVADAWSQFRRDRFERSPNFRYRPLPVDPVLLKRQLYQIPMERVEDPVLLALFREKQDELDRRITMLLEQGTPRFPYASVLLHGGADDEEVRQARTLLDTVPSRSRSGSGKPIDAPELARLAEREIEYYRRQWPHVTAKVKLRGDIAGGMMVSRGSLLVSRTARLPAGRVDSLLQHEVGTHVLTYFNGRAQPFKQLYSGLAGYESLQEGIAVLSEYLAGGLSKSRLRMLAARVVAVRCMLDGASFVETFRELDRNYDFSQRTAFQVTMRVYRGGGLTKDAIYLRGLREVLAYLAGGGKLEPLLVGKIALEHLPVIRELQYREVLVPAPLRPRYLDDDAARRRLERTRKGLEIVQLVERERGT